MSLWYILLAFYVGGVIHGIGGVLVQARMEQNVPKYDILPILGATLTWPFGITYWLAVTVDSKEDE